MPPWAIRTAVSAGPPGGNGTMILMGFVGNAWANAPRGNASARAAAVEWIKNRAACGHVTSPVSIAASLAPRHPHFNARISSEILPPPTLCII